MDGDLGGFIPRWPRCPHQANAAGNIPHVAAAADTGEEAESILRTSEPTAVEEKHTPPKVAEEALESQNPLWISIGRIKTTSPQEASYPLVLASGVPTGAEGERKEAAQLTRRRRREQT